MDSWYSVEWKLWLLGQSLPKEIFDDRKREPVTPVGSGMWSCWLLSCCKVRRWGSGWIGPCCLECREIQKQNRWKWWSHIRNGFFLPRRFWEGNDKARGCFDSRCKVSFDSFTMTYRVNSDEKRIQKAYRTILLKNHPDKGGSPYLAAKVNQAKDMLLEGSTTGSHFPVCLKHSIVQSLTLQYLQQSYSLRSYNFPPPSSSTACPPSARTIPHNTRSLVL